MENRPEIFFSCRGKFIAVQVVVSGEEWPWRDRKGLNVAIGFDSAMTSEYVHSFIGCFVKLIDNTMDKE